MDVLTSSRGLLLNLFGNPKIKQNDLKIHSYSFEIEKICAVGVNLMGFVKKIPFCMRNAARTRRDMRRAYRDFCSDGDEIIMSYNIHQINSLYLKLYGYSTNYVSNVLKAKCSQLPSVCKNIVSLRIDDKRTLKSMVQKVRN